jgi:excisionase family DNA binding protein
VVRDTSVVEHRRIPLSTVEPQSSMMKPGFQLSGRYHTSLTKTSKNEENLGGYISQIEAARICGVSKQAIAYQINKGRISGIRVAGRIVVLRSEVEEFAAQAKGGKPVVDSMTMSGDLSRNTENVLDPSAWISQTEAARLRGVSRQSIAELVKKNRFKILKIGGKTLLNRSDVEAFQPHSPGPAPKRRRKK